MVVNIADVGKDRLFYIAVEGDLFLKKCVADVLAVVLCTDGPWSVTTVETHREQLGAIQSVDVSRIDQAGHLNG